MDRESTEYNAALPHARLEFSDCKEQTDTEDKFLLQKDLLKNEQTETFAIVKCEADVQVKLETEEVAENETDAIHNMDNLEINMQIKSDVAGNISPYTAYNISVDQKSGHIKVETMEEKIPQGIVKAEPIDYKVSNDDDRFQDQYDVATNEAGKRVFKCKLCTAYQTLYKWQMKIHIMRHLANKQFKCELCDYKAAVKSELLKHMTRHRVKKSLRCIECDFSTNNRKSLKMHEKSHLAVKPFNCKYCDFGCASKFHLLEHQKRHEETQYSCDTCSYQTHVKRELLAHKKTHTGNQMRKTFHCNSCPYFSTTKSDLRNHLQYQHSSERRYRCDRCSFSDKDISLLVTHMKTHLQ